MKTVYYKLSFILMFLLLSPAKSEAVAGSDDLSVWQLRVEYLDKPLGIDRTDPRLFWKIQTDRHATMQSAYQVQVATGRENLQQGDLIWDTGEIESDRTTHLHYAGPELESTRRYYWRVRVRDNYGRLSDWSEVSWWEMGLLETDRWRAEWIRPDLEENVDDSPPAPMLRSEFDLDGEIRSARAYVTAHGVYEVEINGVRVGEQALSPGWTSYHNRLQYQTYDVTGHLVSGENAVGVQLGDGWFRGYMGFQDQRNYYGTELALLLQLEVILNNGQRVIVGTDQNWRSATGPILKSDIYNGEFYDARLEKEGWSSPGFDDRDWSGVQLPGIDKSNLVAQMAPPVRKIQELKPREIIVTPEGETVVDMGQNLIGWIRLRVEGEAGTEVKLRHAEVLDRFGNFYTDNLRAADQENRYTLKGDGVELWEPRFTFQGFRYVAVEGYPGELTLDDLTAIVLHSDMEPTGHFQSSNSLINQLQHNIVWGQKGNFLDIPTDCPQRDERLGWTGDIQVFAETANLNMNTAGFLTKWLADLEADQLDNGSVPHVVPDVLPEGWDGASGWADAAVIVPWSLYQAYGDTDILQRQYTSMKSWVDYVRQRAASSEPVRLWTGDFTFGDWLAFSTTNPDYPGAYTEKDLISSAYFAWSSLLLSKAAGVLGREDDRREYESLYERVREAFQREYITPSGRLMSNTQTAYLLALQFGLIPEPMIERSVGHLIENIDHHGHLTTGFLGTPHLNNVLSRFGHTEQAYELLFRKEYPSWLYPVTMGATTIWERWDGIRPDGTFQSEGMNSLNHYAYGAIGEWLYREVAGIGLAEEGYGKILIRPHLNSRLNHARAIVTSLHGVIESSWQIDRSGMTLDVEIPPNTTGSITLPYAEADRVNRGAERLSTGNGIQSIEQRESGVVVEVGSGRYTFSWSSSEIDAIGDLHVTSTELAAGMESKIGELLAGSRTRALLNRHAPDLMRSPWLSQVMGFTLSDALELLPEEVGLSASQMEQLESELQSVEGE